MPDSPIIASLERTAAHLAHILEDWSRDCENENLSHLAANSGNPHATSITPTLEVISLAVQCLVRLTAVEKTIAQLKNPNSRLFCTPSSTRPSLVSPVSPSTSSAQSTAPQSSVGSAAPSSPDPDRQSPLNDQFFQPSTFNFHASSPSIGSIGSIGSIPSIPPVRSLLTRAQMQALLAATNDLYANTACVAADYGIAMPSLDEIDSLALDGESPTIIDISRSVKKFQSDFKSLAQIPRSPPALC